jgi:hypothetical protein
MLHSFILNHKIFFRVLMSPSSYSSLLVRQFFFSTATPAAGRERSRWEELKCRDLARQGTGQMRILGARSLFHKRRRRAAFMCFTGAYNIKVSDSQQIILKVQRFDIIYLYRNQLRLVPSVALAEMLTKVCSRHGAVGHRC